MEDTSAKVLITTDGQNRRGKVVPVKVNADEACSGENNIEHVIVVDRTSASDPVAHAAVPWTEGRDVWYHDLVDDQPDTHAYELHDAEDPLFIIYTSGTTGKPKGLVHTMGGYLVQTAYTHALLYDLLPDYVDENGVLRPDELSAVNDPEKVASTVHWCTADLAWVTAHTYEIYGPLVNGVSEVIYEGTPNTPHFGRHFEVIERYGVTNYYTAPTLIRSLMGAFPNGPEPGKYDFSTVRLLGSVGESINPEAWRWLRQHVGGGTAAFIDTWWQSETGSTVCSPRPHDPAFAPEGTYPEGTPHCTPCPVALPAPFPACPPAWWMSTVIRSNPASRASSWSIRLVPRWLVPCGRTRSVSWIPIGVTTASAAGSWPATARRKTKRVMCTSSAVLMT